MFAKLKANRAFLRKLRTSACVTNQDEHDNVHCSVCLEVKRERERESQCGCRCGCDRSSKCFCALG